jgi:hypothetical protein
MITPYLQTRTRCASSAVSGIEPDKPPTGTAEPLKLSRIVSINRKQSDRVPVFTVGQYRALNVQILTIDRADYDLSQLVQPSQQSAQLTNRHNALIPKPF